MKIKQKPCQSGPRHTCSSQTMATKIMKRKLTDTSLVLFNLKPHDKQMTESMNEWTTEWLNDWMNEWMTGILTSQRLAGQQTTLKSKV